MTERNVTLDATFGKINTRDELVTSSVFKLNKPFSRVSAAASSAEKISNTYRDSTSLGKLGGGFSSSRVTHPEGTVLLAQSSLSRRNLRVADGAVLFRLREAGPLVTVLTKLPVSRLSLLGESIITLTARGDILSIEEARALGYVITPSYEREFFEQEEIDRLLEVREIAPGSPKPTVTIVSRGDGRTKTLVLDAPRQRRVVARRRVSE